MARQINRDWIEGFIFGIFIAATVAVMVMYYFIFHSPLGGIN